MIAVETATDRQLESLERARNGRSTCNELSVIVEFAARGIPESEIQPRENVLTYNAWRAVGRQVKTALDLLSDPLDLGIVPRARQLHHPANQTRFITGNMAHTTLCTARLP